MEQPIQARQAAVTNNSALESQIRENFGRVVYSHKVHEKCADEYTTKLKRIKLAQIILSAITTGSLLSAILGNNTASAIVATVFSTILLVLNAYTKDYGLGELAQKHVDTATRLWAVREAYLSLLTDSAEGLISPSHVREKRDELNESLAAIYQNAPRTTSKAYAEAQKALKINEELTFSDEEIDMFLPRPLRRVQNG